MMMKLRELFSLDHKRCKIELRQLIQDGLDANKKIQSLNLQILTLTNQIQELKAINDYQTSDLEKKITELETEHNRLKSKRERPKS